MSQVAILIPHMQILWNQFDSDDRGRFSQKCQRKQLLNEQLCSLYLKTSMARVHAYHARLRRELDEVALAENETPLPAEALFPLCEGVRSWSRRWSDKRA